MYQGKNYRNPNDRNRDDRDRDRDDVFIGGKRKYRHWIHSPFTIDHAGVKVAVDKNGKMVFTQDHPDGTFDEIQTSESLINRLIIMLQATRKAIYKDEPFVEEGEVTDAGKT